MPSFDRAELKMLEGLALRLAETPQVQVAREAARRIFVEDEYAKTPDGAASVEDAVDQHVWGALMLAVNMDPCHPRIPPMFLYRHEIDGQEYPSALHGGLENPDNVYRLVPISPDSRYELRGLRHTPAPSQVTYELMDSVPGVLGLGDQIALLMDRDMVLAPDGSFTITLDSDPANGRPNHIRLTPESRCIFVRDTLSDWTAQQADTLSVHRVGGPDSPPKTFEQLTAEAAELVVTYAEFWHDLPKRYRVHLGVLTNAFNPPARRTGGWGFIANTHFEVGPGEAFVFTCDPKAAPYHAVLIGNHWWIAMDADLKSGAFNTSQAQPNADGTITYVIASEDPGAHNWLDTGGLGEGIVQVRWQGTPPEMMELPDAIGGARLVEIGALKEVLAPETKWLTAEERREQLAARHASYVKRLDD